MTVGVVPTHPHPRPDGAVRDHLHGRASGGHNFELTFADAALRAPGLHQLPAYAALHPTLVAEVVLLRREHVAHLLRLALRLAEELVQHLQ